MNYTDKELESEHSRYLIARIETTSSEMLDTLHNDKSWVIRREIGRNPNTSTETLEKMWNDESFLVREAIASNYNTSISILKELMKDEFGRIKTNAKKTLAYKSL